MPAIFWELEVRTYRSLYLWFEGPNDDEFIEQIITPRIVNMYDAIQKLPYAGLTNQYVNNYIKSLASMPADYIFFADIDDTPCVTQKKAALQRRYNSLDLNKIIVVKKEIESWYLAGLDEATCAALNLRSEPNTEAIDKEQFNRMKPGRFRSRLDFMIEILKYYDIETAKSKNQSFAYFANKHGL